VCCNAATPVWDSPIRPRNPVDVRAVRVNHMAGSWPQRYDFVLSIVIPTLNAARCLGGALDALNQEHARLGFEVIVSDGGSVDDTRFVAAKAGGIFLDGPRGRGNQLAAGAEAAAGDWLLFLHADTVLATGWADAVAEFIADAGNVHQAAVFRFVLDDDSVAARWLERTASWRTRTMGLPYGDQGLLISRPLYERLGGFRAMPLMEDVDIVRRIGQDRLRVLDVDAVTAADRYRRDGYLFRPLRNLVCLGLYVVGVPPRYIDPLYR